MNSLSDSQPPIVDKWAKEAGRYTGISQMNQGFLSPLRDESREIERGYLAAALLHRLWPTDSEHRRQ